MSAVAIPPSKWRKGTVITLNGEPYTLTSKPKKAIDGSWIMFMTNAEGKVLMQYITNEQIEGLKS
jgi:hypothetical protein